MASDGWRRWRRRLGRMAKFGAAAGVGVFAVSLWWFDPPLEESTRYPAGVALRDRTGALLRVGLGPDDQDCRPWYRADPEDWVVQALVASEDKRFWRHHGVDVLSLLRAVRQNVTTGRRISGASTITSQAVRLITPHPRKLRWKYVEAFQAMRLEMAMTKLAIIEQYLNRAPMASNLVGIEAGAMGWFGKPAKSLSLGEAALLVGMVQSPSRFRPDRNMAAALRRREYVLGRMLALGLITDAQKQGAESAALVVRRAPRPFEEPYFADWAQSSLPRAGGDYTTTLDPGIQRALARRVDERAADLGCSAAGVVLDVRTGAVRALACSGDYFADGEGQVNAALAPRPAGSTLKPFIFASALDRGIVAPAETLLDVPRHFSGGFSPVNFDGGFRGRVSAAEALVLSLNIPFITLVSEVGLVRFNGTLHALGLDTVSPSAQTHGAGIAVGNADVRLLDLANAYATIARGGVHTPPRALESGEPAVGPRLFSEAACWLVSDILSGDARAQGAVGHIAAAKLPRAAWKTGTSAANRDAWTVVWNPEHVVAVWCGHKRGNFGDESIVGIAAAAPAAWEVMRDLYPSGDAPWYDRPADVVERDVCAASGQPASTLCPERRVALAIRGRSSGAVCRVHQMGADGRVTETWPGFGGVAVRSEADESATPVVVSPSTGSVFKRLPGFPGQGIAARAGKVGDGETLWWFLDASPVGTTPGGGTLHVPMPRPGAYRLTCSTASGRSASATFTVE